MGNQQQERSMNTTAVIHIVGARPQFIKLSPVAEAFKRCGIPYKVVHTGQHYDHAMSDVHFDTLGIDPPDYHLGVGSSSHAKQTARMLEAVEEILTAERPSLVLVYGDTNSTLAGALCAVKLGIPVGHVEAGVRSFDRNMPEEINRVVTDHVAAYHFCPTENAVALLAKEGITGIFTGDVMYDALNRFSRMHIPHPYAPPFVLTTIHRAENTDRRERFLGIWKALENSRRTSRSSFPFIPGRKTFSRPHPLGENGIRVIEAGELPRHARHDQGRIVCSHRFGRCAEGAFSEDPLCHGQGHRVAGDDRRRGECPGGARSREDPSGRYGYDRQNRIHRGQPVRDGSASDHIARFIREHII